ncbi:MAG: 3-oxoacyl-ACP reductase FabG [Rhodanobacteraceae bacterium]
MSQVPRRALVTGGSGDIGGAICRTLAREGWHPIVHANANPGRAQGVVDAIADSGGTAEAIAFDLADGEATRTALEKLLDADPIAALVHNAGIHDDAPLAGMREEQWSRVIDVSLNGFFHAAQPLLLPMSRARFGRIVCISSIAAVTGNRGQVNYAAAKSALHGAAKSLAREMAARGITVNVIAPGLIEGSMTHELFAPEQIRQMIPAARMGTPQEVANAVAFLCSDGASYVNGQIIGVNGGMA